MFKTDKIVQIRRQKGKSLRVLREHYVREDIPCQSQLCLADCQQLSGKEQNSQFNLQWGNKIQILTVRHKHGKPCQNFPLSKEISMVL